MSDPDPDQKSASGNVPVDHASLIDSLIAGNPNVLELQSIPRVHTAIQVAVGYAFKWVDVRDFLLASLPDTLPIKAKVCEYFSTIVPGLIPSMAHARIGIRFSSQSRGVYHGDSVSTGPQLLDWFMSRHDKTFDARICNWYVTKAKSQDIIAVEAICGTDRFYWIIYNPNNKSTFVLKKALEKPEFYDKIAAANDIVCRGGIPYFY
jgi:hypothetical protein